MEPSLEERWALCNIRSDHRAYVWAVNVARRPVHMLSQWEAGKHLAFQCLPTQGSQTHDAEGPTEEIQVNNNFLSLLKVA